MPRLLTLALLALLAAPAAHAQPIDVTFRFIPDLDAPGYTDVVRAFVPGEFNDWGPNSSGQIAVGAPSQMTYDAALDEYRYTVQLAVGTDYEYKVHYHKNASGTSYEWITDPLNPLTDGTGFNDSVIEVRDPMVFQLAREEDASGRVVAVSAGVFGTEDITALSYAINDGAPQDGLASYDASTGIFRVELPTSIPGNSKFEITATDALSRTATASVGNVPPTVVDEARPAGIEAGIYYDPANPARVTLSFFAPNKDYVHLIGDFTGWQVDDRFLLKRDRVSADEVYWWTTVTVNASGDYAFQYLVDGEQRIADPFSELVVLPEDSNISPATFPNRPPYPAEAAGKPATILTFGGNEYQWQTQNYTRPDEEDLVVYELLVRDFLQAHDYQTLRDTLDYLDNLGVTAIELMPVAEFGGNENWGYQPLFALAPDKYYGPPDALKAFVDEAHARGIAVILDVVYNHQDAPGALVELYGCTESGPFTNNPARHPFNVFCDLDHEHAFVQYWLDEANRHWIEEYRVDGFRYDLSKGFTQRDTGGDVGAWGNYDASRIALLKRMADVVWDTVDPEAYLILEHFATQSEQQELANYRRGQGQGFMLWNNQNRPYSQSAMGYLSDSGQRSDLRFSYPPNAGYPVEAIITYMESHDEQWLMYRNRAYGPVQGDYNVRDLSTALDRQKLVAGFFLTIPGPRMIWQFGELGYGWGNSGEQCLEGTGDNCPARAPSRTGNKPIRWDYRADPERFALYQVYAALNRIRVENDVFTSPDTQVTLRVGQGVADRRIGLSLPGAPGGQPSEVVVIGNFGLTERAVNPAFPSTGTWYDFFNDGAPRDITAASQNTPLSLLPGEFRVFTNAFVEPPPSGLVATPVEPGPTGGTAAFGLGTAYPNPARGTTTVPFALGASGPASLEVFDVLGRRVAVLHEGDLAAGPYTASFETADLPAGVYVIRLQAGDETATQRITVVR